MERLTDEWFAAGRALARDLPTIPGLDFAVELRSAPDGRTWHQEVRDGRVVRWDLGPHPEPELVLEVPEAEVGSIHAPEPDGTAVLGAVRVVLADGSLHLPAPMDVTETAEIHGLPTVPGADLQVQYHLLDGPFGAVDTWWRFTDGRFDTAALGTIDDADVVVSAGFAQMAALRRGEITVLEALEGGGRVDGEVGPLMLLAGLHEGDLQAAQHAAGPSSPVLGAMGRLRATEPHRAVLAALATRTA
jgi:hypothetical protein